MRAAVELGQKKASEMDSILSDKISKIILEDFLGSDSFEIFKWVF